MNKRIDRQDEKWRTLTEGERLGYGLGQYLGFPECCIKQFFASSIDRLKEQHQKLSTHPFRGTGYVPCDHCITLDADELKDTINNNNNNRVFQHPFPFKGCVFRTAGEHFEEYQRTKN